MAFVLCTLPNAGSKINGVDFIKHERGMVSPTEVDDQTAAYFEAVPGYELVDAQATAATKKAAKPAATAAA